MDEDSQEYLVGAVLAQIEDATDQMKLAVLADALGSVLNAGMENFERRLSALEGRIHNVESAIDFSLGSSS